MNKTELAAVCWAALEGVARKETRRDALLAGMEYDVALRVIGEVKGRSFGAETEAHLVVNEDGARIASEAAPLAHLVGYLLGLLPKTQREALLRDLPEQYAAADYCLPPTDRSFIEAAENLLGRLRTKVQKQVRGSISTSYVIGSLTT